MTRLTPAQPERSPALADRSSEPIEVVIELLAAILESRSASSSTPENAPGAMLTVAQTAALLGMSRTTVIRKADTGELPCVVMSQGTRKKMRRFPQALIEDLALRAGGGAQTGLGEYAATWLASVARTSAVTVMATQNLENIDDKPWRSRDT